MTDARLAAPALAAWGAVAVVLLVGLAHEGSRMSWAIASALALCLLAVSAALRWRSATSAGIAMAVVAASVVALLQAIALWSGPVAAWAAEGRHASVLAVLESEPRPLTGPVWQSRPQAMVNVATSMIEVGGERLAVALPMSVRCSCGVDDLVVGSSVLLRGRLAPARSVGEAAVLALDDDARPVVVGPPGLLDDVATGMRAGLRRALAERDAAPASLVAGLATGDVSLMPSELAARMKATGLSHLTAVSGANVAIVVALAMGSARLLRARLRLQVVVGLLAIVGFVLLVRPEPSVMRAAFMGGLVVVAMLSGGRRAGPAVLAAAVLLLVLVAPQLAVSWGFVLSVVATLGIIAVAPVVQIRLPGRVPVALAVALGVTIAAQAATLPVLLAMGASVSWVSIPANLLVGIVVAPVTILGLLAALMSPLLPGAAALLAHAAVVPASVIVLVARWAEGLPGAGLTWPAGSRGLLLLVVLIALLPLARRRWRRSFTVTVVIAIALLLIDPPGARSWPPPGWVIVACDVGQGDALVLRGSAEAVMVVDTGPDDARLSTCLRDLGVTRIGVLVLTHFHADHVGGLAAAYELPVDAVLVSPVQEPPETFAAADRLLRGHAEQSPIRTAAPGMRVQLPGIDAAVLWPAARIDAGSVPNNGSIVLQVLARGVPILLSGDVEREAQAAIARLPRPDIAVLKAPHHGSANLDPAFVRWAQAPITLISVGAGNDYGHPAPDALTAWSGGALGRTDTDGALAIVPGEGGLALVRRG